MIVACGDRADAKLAKDAETRWRRAVDAWPHRRHATNSAHLAQASGHGLGCDVVHPGAHAGLGAREGTSAGRAPA
jgi:hypothetical protein